MVATAAVAVVLAGVRFVWINPDSVGAFFLLGLPGVSYVWFMMRVVVPWANRIRPDLEKGDTSLFKFHTAFGNAVFWSGTVFLATLLFGLSYYLPLLFVLAWMFA